MYTERLTQKIKQNNKKSLRPWREHPLMIVKIYQTPNLAVIGITGSSLLHVFT